VPALDLPTFGLLLALGFGVGAVGTLVGAGGGFLLVPALLLLRPEASPASVTSISLAVVFFNAYSGTLAYMRMGRIDYFAAVLFALAGAPGAVLGVLLVHEVPRGAFHVAFGVLLLAVGSLIVHDPLGARSGRAVPDHADPSANALRDDPTRMRVGSIGSAYVAAFASLLGLGGGIVHVPFLVRVLRFPPHVATATSHFVLAFMALLATSVHMATGTFGGGQLGDTLALAVGVMMGAPVGAALSTRIQGASIVRVLGAALCVVGFRLLWHLHGG
jgi:uncharacterized membrane protein YfcA